MKPVFVSMTMTVMMTLGVAGTADAQSGAGAPPTAERLAEVEVLLQEAASGGRARAVVESRVTRGAPYSADAVTEFTQTLPDGNRISQRSVTRTFRDSDGRTRREAANDAGETLNITIFDPVANASFVLDPRTRTARRSGVFIARPVTLPAGHGGGRGRGGGTAAPATVPPVPPDAETVVEQRRVERSAATARAQGVGGTAILTPTRSRTPGETTSENLGTQVIEGVLAEGTRSTTVIPAGAIGNAQPITIVSERWFSPDLQVLVLTRHSDPRTGETVYRLSNLVRGEPDRALFEVPADYTVK